MLAVPVKVQSVVEMTGKFFALHNLGKVNAHCDGS